PRASRFAWPARTREPRARHGRPFARVLRGRGPPPTAPVPRGSSFVVTYDSRSFLQDGRMNRPILGTLGSRHTFHQLDGLDESFSLKAQPFQDRGQPPQGGGPCFSFYPAKRQMGSKRPALDREAEGLHTQLETMLQ